MNGFRTVLLGFGLVMLLAFAGSAMAQQAPATPVQPDAPPSQESVPAPSQPETPVQPDVPSQPEAAPPRHEPAPPEQPAVPPSPEATPPAPVAGSSGKKFPRLTTQIVMPKRVVAGKTFTLRVIVKGNNTKVARNTYVFFATRLNGLTMHRCRTNLVPKGRIVCKIKLRYAKLGRNHFFVGAASMPNKKGILPVLGADLKQVSFTVLKQGQKGTSNARVKRVPDRK